MSVTIKGVMTLWRRHLNLCPHRAKGRRYTKCTCPIWCDGELNGKRYRQSLKTRDWQRAIRKLAALEDPKAARVKPIAEAITAYGNHILSLTSRTQDRYKNAVDHFAAYCREVGLEDMSEITIEHLDRYRANRKLAPTTLNKDLSILRQFFGFCFDRRWIDENPGKKIKLARNIKPTEKVPYTQAEVAKMLAACDIIGNSSYERLRSRAAILLLRYTGLRISDVATLERKRVQNGKILLYTQKTGGTVFLPIPDELQRALDALPCPRGAEILPLHFFWNGTSGTHALISGMARTLTTVFKRAGVHGAHAHRFRHTLATEILARGGTAQDAADILGISIAIVLKHYAKWSLGRQERITKLFEAVYPGTYLAHDEKGTVIN
jgi:integrase/recombinase XerC